MIKAIFFDIDGTLVSFKTHKMPESTRAALDTLREKGIKLFTASGRHKATVNNLDGWIPDGHIGVNGGMCQIGDQIIYRNVIEQSDIKSLIAYLKGENAFPAIFVQDNNFIMNYYDQTTDKVFSMLNFPTPPIGALEEVERRPTYQIIAFFSKDQEHRIMQILPHCETTRWTNEFTDIVPKGSNKWKGISKVLDFLGVSPDETMCFGDGGNDIEMLEGAGIGVAMGNASEIVKSHADYITDSVDDQGIFNALKHLGII